MNNGRECEEKKGLLSCPATKEVVEEEFKEMWQGGESSLKLSENKNNSPQVDMGAVQQSGCWVSVGNYTKQTMRILPLFS